MDKLELSSAISEAYPQPHHTRKLMRWIFFILITGTTLLWWMHRGQEAEWLPVPSIESDEFSWSQINPSSDMIYTSCFGIYQCARLSVPMDWNSTSSSGSQVIIAVIKYPAPVSVTDHRYGGAILLNPGGPGGSGVDLMFRDREIVSPIVNALSPPESSSNGKYFDLISFDPRGVNNTTPHLKCFPDASTYDIWRYQEEAEGIAHTSDVSLSMAWVRAKALMGTCSQDNEISKYMNTPPVVRDMVEIIERHGKWRSKQAELWLATKEGKSTITGKENSDLYSREPVIERTKWHQGDEKLQYWGFSYGTILGATFAAINPHRVERLVLDGVVYANDYYNTTWLANLQDTDEIMLRFYGYCSTAGSEKCALSVDNSTASDIQKSVESLISSLRQDPIPVSGNASQGPEIITYSDVMLMVRTLLYRPLEKFPQMADLLADLVHGNGSVFAEYKRKKHKRTCPLPSSQGGRQNSESCEPSADEETTRAILCSDGVDISSRTKEDFKGVVRALYGQSKWFGEFWSTIPMPCIHWKARPTWGITGDEIKGDTAHPILWIGNTLDPVTPLANAHTMSKKFPGSVVLQQDSEGHCTTQSPSACTHNIIRNYFQNGDLPAAGTVCQPDEFPLIGRVTDSVDSMSRDDQSPSIDLRDNRPS